MVTKLNYFVVVGSGNRDPGWKKTGSGIRKKHPRPATLHRTLKKNLSHSTFGIWGFRSESFVKSFGSSLSFQMPRPIRQHRFPEKLEQIVKIKRNKTKSTGGYGTDTFFALPLDPF